MADLDHAEFLRLIGRGLPASTALLVQKGVRDEEFEVAHVETTARAREWCADLTELPEGLEPRWDYAPPHFYLALDGEHPGLTGAQAWVLILAEAAEVLGALNYISSREKAPWDERHRLKSCDTAYRWSVGLLRGQRDAVPGRARRAGGDPHAAAFSAGDLARCGADASPARWPLPPASQKAAHPPDIVFDSVGGQLVAVARRAHFFDREIRPRLAQRQRLFDQSLGHACA